MTSARSVRRSSEMVIAAPSPASAAGTHAMPMTLPELARVARARDLPDGLAARVEHRGALGRARRRRAA